MQSTARYSGSNFTTVLSASAFAVAATTAAPRVEDFHSIEVLRDQNDKYSTISFVDNFVDDDVTDSEFVLGYQIKDNLDRHLRSAEGVFGLSRRAQTLNASHIKPISHSSLNIANSVFLPTRPLESVPFKNIAVDRARDFYENLAPALKSPLIEELVAIFYVAANLPPTVDRVDDMVTLDVVVRGRSLGVLVENDICAISSFSADKELKGTFAVGNASGLDEFKRILFVELASLKA